MGQYNWNSVEDIFRELNETCQYMVIRNYEEIKVIREGKNVHEDIDFLCDNYRKLVETLDAKPRHVFDNKVQYQILLNGKYLKIDVRSVGDGYYDAAWQKDMLSRRRLAEEGYYIPEEKDYFFSLIYHAILQKKKLSVEYREKLSRMGQALGYKAGSEEELLKLLVAEMENNGYLFWYPKDSTVTNRFELVPAELCRGKFRWYIRKVLHFPVRIVRFVYGKMKR